MKKALSILFSLALMILFSLFPQESKDAVISGIKTCGISVIPALFPYFIVSKLLISSLGSIPAPKSLCKTMEFLFGTNGNCASPLLLSFLGGYPVGVSCVVSQYEKGLITKDDAEKALLFCNNSGPGFYVGAVGAAVLGSIRKGLILYVIHIISALMVGRIFAVKQTSHARVKRIPEKAPGFAAEFLNSITDSSAALLKICALILFFTLLLNIIEATRLISTLCSFFPQVQESSLTVIIYGILELTGGIFRLSGRSDALILAAFFMGWGGFCVHFQSISLWQKAALHPKGYFSAKFLHGAFSALITSCIFTPKGINWAIFCLIVALLIFIPEIRKKVGGNSLRYAL